ncbi:MAG TPA: methyltransferase [Gammaproteobacteria bacterium]|nr:methyltransferase [Gammaproteobacteria bacterium]
MNDASKTNNPFASLAPDKALETFIMGEAISRCLQVLAKLLIADRLSQSPETAEVLARETSTHAPSLYRVLRTVASVGVFREDEQGRFHMTPTAELLRTDVPNSMQPWLVLRGEEWHRSSWNKLHATVATGNTAFNIAHDEGLFDYLKHDTDAATIFNKAMAATKGFTQAIVDAYDFSDTRKIIDVGGGYGSLLSAILQKNPHLQGILYDTKKVTGQAKDGIEAAGLTSRCEIIAGDFFTEVPAGADTFLLRRIIHDWDDEKSIKILTNCRQVMNADDKLLLAETIIEPGNALSPGKFYDIDMMVMVGGLERTVDEYAALFEKSGLTLTNVVPTESNMSVLESRPK